jgi:hypothetical protein
MIYILAFLLSLHPGNEDRCFSQLNTAAATELAYAAVLSRYYDPLTANGLAKEVIHGRMSTVRACHYYDVNDTGENQSNPRAYA